MLKVKTKIWLLFYTLLASGIILSSFLSYIQWQHIKKSSEIELTYVNNIFTNSIVAQLNQSEKLLEVLGHNLLRKENYKNTNTTRQLLDNILLNDPSLAGFGLTDTSGTFKITSTNLSKIPLSKLPNLLNNPDSKESFLEAMKSKKMVLGNVYYMKPLGKWVLPLRKSIYDEKGNVVAVMTTGIDLNTFNNLHNSSKDKYSFSLVSAKDFKRLYVSEANPKNIKELYQNKVPEHVINEFKSQLKDNGLTFEDFKKRALPSLFELTLVDNSKRFLLIVYEKKYDVLVVLMKLSSIVVKEFISYLFTIWLTLLLFFIITYYLFKKLDIAESAARKNLNYQLEHDSLTSLPNRNYLAGCKSEWMQKKHFAILFIGLDNFKNVNDAFGHKFGDKVLQEVARRLNKEVPDNDLVTRVGGDEFILLNPSNDINISATLADNLMALLRLPFIIDRFEYRINASIGIANFPQDGKTFEELLTSADIALRHAKKKKDDIFFFDKQLKKDQLHQSNLEQALRLALEKDEIYMMYQPQITVDGHIHGVEALVRWQSEEYGLIPPDTFIQIAEDYGLIIELGDFIIQTAEEEIANIQHELDFSFELSINISVKQFMQSNFKEKILKMLNLSPLKLHINIEITENLFIEDIDYILPILNQLKDIGIKISLDDFGTGYSSLSSLRMLPIDELKIDKSFIDEIKTDKNCAALVKSIINMGNDLGIRTVAEGVETAEQVDILASYGCDIIQGYHFSKPLLIDDLKAYIMQFNR